MSKKLLCDELSDLANYLQANQSITTEPFELAISYVQMAYQQIVEQGDIVLDKPNAQSLIMNAIVCNDSKPNIAKMFDYADFNWHWFDECVRLCQENQLTNNTFYNHLPRPPAKPSLDNKDSLSLLTIPQIKSLLKKYGHQTTGNKQQLVDRLWVFLPIEDTDQLLNAKYNDLYEQYRTRFIRHKYNTLYHTINRRASFLRDLVNFLRLQTNSICKNQHLSLSFASLPECQPQDQELAKLIDGTGYDAVVIEGVLHKLLPIFPYDLAWVRWHFK